MTAVQRYYRWHREDIDDDPSGTLLDASLTAIDRVSLAALTIAGMLVDGVVPHWVGVG